VVEVFDNVITPEEIQILLDYYYQDDPRVDDRLDVRSKTLHWHDTDWPKQIIKRVLDQVLGNEYAVEVVLFYGSKISFKLHVDSGDGDGRPLLKNILIPLHIEGPASTVLFDNYWYGPHVRFGHTPISPFAYSLPDRTGQLHSFNDIRKFLDLCKLNPEQVPLFDITDDFISALEHIVKMRSSNTKPPDNYVTGYSNIINYKPEIKFDPEIHKQFLSHISIEDLHGLTFSKLVPWQLGQVITFDRNQIHSAGSGHDFKIGISIFTYGY
jgi:hypothetical protein